MPLIGLIDQKGRELTWEQVSAGKGDFDDPVPVLMALYPPRSKYCDFSVTELLNDPYQVQLQRRYDYFERPEDMQDRLIGSSLHALFESKSNMDLGRVEESMVVMVKLGGQVYKIGGTPDYVHMILNHTLWDYKTITMSSLARMAKQGSDTLEKYKDQTGMYRWILWKVAKIQITTVCIRFVVKDWRFYEFRRHDFSLPDYPRGALFRITGDELVPLDKIEKLLLTRLRQHVAAERMSDEDLHEAGECDTWHEFIRCNHYCALKSVCHFRMQDKQNNTKKGQKNDHAVKSPRPR